MHNLVSHFPHVLLLEYTHEILHVARCYVSEETET